MEPVKINRLSRQKLRHSTEKEAINSVIASLEDKLHAVVEKRDKIYDKIRDQNRSLLNDARRLAANKDVAALKELSTSENRPPAPVETEVVAEPKAKQPKEDHIPVSVPAPVVEKEKDNKKTKEANGTAKGDKEKIVVEEEDD
ncbi:hypothetical protein Tco_1110327 [Tanacetum coccineum]|uniref:Uncharacterized protein n=1 Tax=Tanacetum coccineum TaxID=301880 RepID=A0ABQ5IIR9_9ASTR